MMILPPQVNTAISMLYAAGYEAFLVGGAVRDYVRGYYYKCSLPSHSAVGLRFF